MNDYWYADDRDLVKWGGAVYLAREFRAKVIYQVPFRRKAKWGKLQIYRGEQQEPKEEIDIPSVVRQYFRDIMLAEGLRSRRVKVVVHKGGPWDTKSRTSYIRKAIKVIRSQPKPRIVLLDPDNGMAPICPNLAHVKQHEVRDIFKALHPGDILAIYQHAWRETKWPKLAARRLVRFIGLTEPDVLYIAGHTIAHDVRLFAVRRR
jgi:hypothetical protein